MAAYGEYAAEVAEDYRRALEDLSFNTRYEISNLTLIARENVENAMAISDVVLDHIKKVGPPSPSLAELVQSLALVGLFVLSLCL